MMRPIEQHDESRDFMPKGPIIRDPKWDLRFLQLAQLVSTWSKDPSTKVGAVLVRLDRTILSVGYNGFPRDTVDSEEELNDRELKYQKVIHAEQNAILNARADTRGSILYTWPPGHAPTCDRCAAHVIQAGIIRVVGVGLHPGEQSELAERWREANERALRWYSEARVVVDIVNPAMMGVPAPGPKARPRPVRVAKRGKR